ncbi:mannose-1-phosphate guanylyltransferase [Cellvibrio zantedeschiae]|uniref:Mannose-1-phosphate guanylyltransferase n=1 Tax=Cellvibrio zantedeschiae TaxID=1237077 RepID=A0ABQ3BA98_9GAMM|nr:nucleotidyltransferase family protein [Cellvibrio zantedeschiae]GGY80730.1 mannose-1-phosphate guanylyltransferase [Cellvibrio zantedeschiae]
MTPKAMILAAGLGQRMRPLTDNLPKPMLAAGGKPLLQYHLEALANAGVNEVIINLAYLGEKIRAFVGSGESFGLSVKYSEEPEPLETAGALLNALHLLGDEPFLLINGDVWTDYPLGTLATRDLDADTLAHLVLVPNPEFHPAGDFSPNPSGRLEDNPQLEKYTFAGISLIHPRLIRDYPNKRVKFPLGEVLRAGIAQSQISAEIYRGKWSDVGTPERLALLDSELKNNN